MEKSLNFIFGFLYEPWIIYPFPNFNVAAIEVENG